MFGFSSHGDQLIRCSLLPEAEDLILIALRLSAVGFSERPALDLRNTTLNAVYYGIRQFVPLCTQLHRRCSAAYFVFFLSSLLSILTL